MSIGPGGTIFIPAGNGPTGIFKLPRIPYGETEPEVVINFGFTPGTTGHQVEVPQPIYGS